VKKLIREDYKDQAGLWRWRARSINGNILADSGEGYKRRAAAVRGFESVRKAVEVFVKRLAS
jgi:uncharacterized protein YegP (UPF0339 family)